MGALTVHDAEELAGRTDGMFTAEGGQVPAGAYVIVRNYQHRPRTLTVPGPVGPCGVYVRRRRRGPGERSRPPEMVVGPLPAGEVAVMPGLRILVFAYPAPQGDPEAGRVIAEAMRDDFEAGQ